METLEALLARPAGLVAIACLAVVVIAANLVLLIMLRGVGPTPGAWQRFVQSLNKEAIIWRRSVTGGGEAQKRQQEQLDELRQLVSRLQAPPDEVGSKDQKS